MKRPGVRIPLPPVFARRKACEDCRAVAVAKAGPHIGDVTASYDSACPRENEKLHLCLHIAKRGRSKSILHGLYPRSSDAIDSPQPWRSAAHVEMETVASKNLHCFVRSGASQESRTLSQIRVGPRLSEEAALSHRTQFDWWGATAQGSNPATAGSFARAKATALDNPLTSTSHSCS